MSSDFFTRPILNSPYEYPGRHWELDGDGQPTNRITDRRRRAEFITPIPKPKKRKRSGAQTELVFDEGAGLSTAEQQYDPTSVINEIRRLVDAWRELPNPSDWRVTPETARLLQHWRTFDFQGIRPFFCQIEAVETAIWLTEVVPSLGKTGRKFLDHLQAANEQANPDLMRIALKLATGAGKTTVMAMLIAWQTVNAVRRPNSKRFTRGFLVVTPGITIRDRLRVLQPNDPDSYYESCQLVPHDMQSDLERAKIVITNYHAFKLRERTDLSKGTRAALEGWRNESLQTVETEGQMIQRVMPELMGIKNILVLNDEAHHCYREKPGSHDEEDYKGDDKQEAKKNNEAARLWISGIEAVNRKIGVRQVFDLSATPFFLKGSGYAEGTLFPWTMSDFSLMDAIECGIVKLPRVPVADNIPGEEMPKFRNLWEHIRTRMPKKGRGKAKSLDPLSLPVELQTALEALYGHYAKTYELWEKEGIAVPPCFIIVCNNTSASKLVYDFISGFDRENDDGSTTLENGRLELFRNYDEYGNRLPRPFTLLIDSEQLESGDALDKNFRDMAADEIDRFRREIRERTGDMRAADNIDDSSLLREVMNTVGKKDRLGESIRCVVSVGMLTEGFLPTGPSFASRGSVPRGPPLPAMAMMLIAATERPHGQPAGRLPAHHSAPEPFLLRAPLRPAPTPAALTHTAPPESSLRKKPQRSIQPTPPVKTQFTVRLRLFVASQTGGDRAAVLFSLVASCKANQVEPWAYLRDIFTRLPEMDPDDRSTLDALLPDVWLAAHPHCRWHIDALRRRERSRRRVRRPRQSTR